MNNVQKTPLKVSVGQRSLRHIILFSDWSVGASPFCKQTEMDRTPFEEKKIFVIMLLPLIDGNFYFFCWCHLTKLMKMYTLRLKICQIKKKWI